MYINASSCITCTKQDGTERKLMPIKEEGEAVFFERSFSSAMFPKTIT